MDGAIGMVPSVHLCLIEVGNNIYVVLPDSRVFLQDRNNLI
jgi:hypothetical protein